MKKVLVMQSRMRPEMCASEQEQYQRTVTGLPVELVFVSTLDEALAWEEPQSILRDCSAVMIAGSGEFDFDGGRAEEDEVRKTSQVILKRLRPLLAYLEERKIPTLGICYGHQIIGAFHGVSVVHDPSQRKVGTFPVVVSEEGSHDPIFSALPHEFLAQYGHKDSLSDLPKGAVVLASGDACRTSALRYSPYLYTTQFHPELTASDVAEKLRMSPGYLPAGIDAASITKESKEASSIIPRFLSYFLVDKP